MPSAAPIAMSVRMNIAEIKAKIHEKRDILVIILIIVVVLVLFTIGMNMQKNYGIRKRAEEEARRPPEKVTLQAERSSTGGKAGNENDGQTGGTAAGDSGAATYYLKPSAEELMSLIRESGQTQLPQESQQYSGFRVMWPCYFFQVLKQEGSRATVLLDVSEDGFGATIVTDLDTQRYPEVLGLQRGQKIWLAGEIVGVDGTGTGTIHIISEEVRFEEGLLDALRPAETIPGPSAVPGQVQ